MPPCSISSRSSRRARIISGERTDTRAAPSSSPSGSPSRRAQIVSIEPSAPATAPFEEWWTRTCALAGPLAKMLAGLAPDVAEALRARAREAVRAYETPSGLDFPGLSLLASAHRE